MIYTVRIQRLDDGTYVAVVDGFGGFRCTGPTVDDVKAWTPAALYAHIDDLQREHDPVISATGVEFVVDEPPA